MYVQLVLDNSIGLIAVPEGIFMFPLSVPPCSVHLSPVYGFFSILLAGLAANSVCAASLEAAARFALAGLAVGAGAGALFRSRMEKYLAMKKLIFLVPGPKNRIKPNF